MTFGYNGLGRINSNETGSVGGGNGWGETGLTRMFSSQVGGQISWLIPSALILLAAGLYLRRRRPRTDARRAAYVVWGGWLVVTMLTFSLMAGIFHEYYTVALALAVGALVGMGAREAWEHRERAVGSVTLAAATATTATWSFLLLSRVDWLPWLRVGVLALGRHRPSCSWPSRSHRRWVPAVLAAALVAALAGPAAYSVATVSTGHTGSIVTAGPAMAGGRGHAGRGPGARPGGPRGPGARDRPTGAGGMGGPGRENTRHRGRGGPVRGLRRLHLGGRRGRLAERGRAAARDRAARHGHRRLQRRRPSPTLEQFQVAEAGASTTSRRAAGAGAAWAAWVAESAAAARSRRGCSRTSRR